MLEQFIVLASLSFHFYHRFESFSHPRVKINIDSQNTIALSAFTAGICGFDYSWTKVQEKTSDNNNNTLA